MIPIQHVFPMGIPPEVGFRMGVVIVDDLPCRLTPDDRIAGTTCRLTSRGCPGLVYPMECYAVQGTGKGSIKGH